MNHGVTPTEPSFNRKLLLPLISGAILNPVNSSILAVALIPISVAFGAPPAQTTWLVTSLYLATSIGQPVVGKLIDILGPRKLFLPAAAVVGIAGIIGALAPNLGVLIAARVLLGFGTCAGYPAAMRTIRDESTRTGTDSPASVLTLLAVATQTIAVIGPPLGGLLIGLGGWRMTLAINVPIALLAFIFGYLRLPKTTMPARPAGEKRKFAFGLDVLGIVHFALTLVSLLLFLTSPSWPNSYLLMIFAVALAGFVFRELKCADPFIDVRMLARNIPLVRTYIRSLLAYLVAYSFLYGYTQWLEDGRGLKPELAGLATLPVFAMGIIVSLLAGKRGTLRGKLSFSAGTQIVACAALLFLGSSSPLWLLVIVAVIFGIPQGLNNLGLQNSVYLQADPATVGASAGMLRTFSYVGAIASSAAQGIFFRHSADTSGLHHLSWLLIGVAVVFFVLTLLDRALSRRSAATSTTTTATS